MATKEKWIDLFEKAVGHPPHVLEIEEGQKSDFDLKAIKGISAMGLDQEVTSPELTEKIDEYDVAEEVVEDVALDDEEERLYQKLRSSRRCLAKTRLTPKNIHKLLLKKHK